MIDKFMDVDQPWLKHGVVSENGTVCWELTIFLAMPYPYQITVEPLLYDHPQNHIGVVV